MILLDTEVILDVALERDPHVEASAALLDQIERGSRSAFVAWHTLANRYHLVRPARGDADTGTFLLELTRFVTVSPTDSDAFRFAASLEMSEAGLPPALDAQGPRVRRPGVRPALQGGQGRVRTAGVPGVSPRG